MLIINLVAILDSISVDLSHVLIPPLHDASDQGLQHQALEVEDEHDEEKPADTCHH